MLTKSNFLLRCLCSKLLLSHLFLPFYFKMYSFFKPTAFIVVWKSCQKISWGYLQYISFYSKNNFVFFQMSVLRTTFLTESICIFWTKTHYVPKLGQLIDVSKANNFQESFEQFWGVRLSPRFFSIEQAAAITQ